MTLLITSVRVDTLLEVETRASAAIAGDAEAIELRIDTFRDPPALLSGFLAAHANRIWIVTRRTRAEGGCADAPPVDRAKTLAEVVRGTGAHVDFEFADWRASPEAREALARGLASSHAKHLRLILSAHNVDRPFENVAELVEEMLAERTACAVKIAYRAHQASDSFAALDLMRRHGNRVCAIAMGSCGQWTRVLARKLGAWGTYCAATTDAATAPGQVGLHEMTGLFRWNDIRASTRVFGVVGDPVAHSMGPLMFNDWFGTHGIDAVYVPLTVPGGDPEFRAFADGVRARPWLDVHGLSVTLPHKQRALAWCGGGADSMARSIGAANTLMLSAKPRALNTDCYAAIDSLCAALGCDRRDLRNIRVDVLGAGGVARGIVYGLREYGCRGTIYARALDRAAPLAGEFGFEAAEWSARCDRPGDVLVNATSVGMSPNVAVSPMPPDALEGYRLVFDTIYNPLETKLLARARSCGVSTLNGLDMFVRQGAMQFELWTGVRPDMTRAATAISRRLQNRTEGDR